MELLTLGGKIAVWVTAKLTEQVTSEIKVRRNADSPKVRRALAHSVRHGASQAAREVYGDDRPTLRRARRALLHGRKKYWPLLDRTGLQDLPYSVRHRVSACRLPALPETGLVPVDHPIISSWCRAILYDIEVEATRREQTLSNLWLAFKQECIDPIDTAETLPPSVLAKPGWAVAQQLSNRQISVTPPFGKLDRQTRGRNVLISTVVSAMEQPGVHVLAGPGGSGKTRVALEIARRAQREGRAVWWVPANRINSSMREVATQIGVPESQIDQAWTGRASPTDLTWRFLDLAPQPWLLIVDNADDPSILDPSGDPVSNGTGWLRRPTGTQGSVIVTSRDRNQETWGPWSTIHSVDPLDSDSGAHLLMDLTGGDAGTFPQARRLSVELGGLPLALLAAAKYLRSVHSAKIWTEHSDINDFESYRVRVRQWLDSPAGTPGGGSVGALGLETVQHAMGLSLDLLTRRGQSQVAPLLRALACLSIAPIPYPTLLDPDVLGQSRLFSGTSQGDVVRMLDTLADIGLIDLHRLEGITDPRLSNTLSLHPVFQGIMRNDDDVRRNREDYYGLNIELILNALRTCDPDLRDNWQRWYVLAPHAVDAVRTALLGDGRVEDSKLIQSAIELGRLACRWLIVSGLLNPAEDLVAPLIERCGDYGFDPDDPEVLGLRHEHGRIMLERGNSAAAEHELANIIEHRTRLLGIDHPDTLASRHKHARAILEQGRWPEAEPLLADIVQAENENPLRGPEHSDTMVVRHSLARSILFQGRPAEAATMLRDILDVMHRNWPGDHPQTLFVRQSLVISLSRQGYWEEAETEVTDALATAEARPGSPEHLLLRHQYALVLLGLGRDVEARRELTGLHRDELKALGMKHPTTEMTGKLLASFQEAFPE